jgi:protein-L-isoaspartate(D-aspartate) O-methyltransferase
MLEHATPTAGQRVLEIGAGTGYNAALLAHLTGSNGKVTTVDIEAFAAERARGNLQRLGFEGVNVVHGDGGLGFAPDAPYDWIVATVGVWEVPPTWMNQLTPGAKIALPLHVGTKEPELHAYTVLERHGDHLEGEVVNWFNMVTMRGGAGAHPQQPESTAAGGAGFFPQRIRVHVYGRDDEKAPRVAPLSVDGQRATKVMERSATLIKLEME